MTGKLDADEARKLFREIILDKTTTDMTTQADWRIASMIAMFAWMVVKKEDVTEREIRTAIWGATYAGMKHGIGKSEEIKLGEAFTAYVNAMDLGDDEDFSPQDFIDWE